MLGGRVHGGPGGQKGWPSKVTAGPCATWAEAENAASVRVLFALFPTRPMGRLFPAPLRDLWCPRGQRGAELKSQFNENISAHHTRTVPLNTLLI